MYGYDFCFFTQNTAYGLRIRDWSSDVCSSDLPFDLVGIDIGRRSLNRGGQVENDGFFARRLQYIHHRLTAFEAEIQFRRGEGFRRIFKVPVRVGLPGGFVPDDLGGINGNLLDLRPVASEHSSPPRRRNHVVDMAKS